jgi:hypothetical protein
MVIEFPLRYLEIPLSVSSLPKTVWLRLIDSVADKLPPWKGKLMHESGRLTLIKSTLAAVPIHTAISLELPAWDCQYPGTMVPSVPSLNNTTLVQIWAGHRVWRRTHVRTSRQLRHKRRQRHATSQVLGVGLVLIGA